MHKDKYTICIVSSNEECKANAILCHQIERYCRKNNHKLTDDPINADFVLINTCGAIDYFEQKSLRLFKDFSDGSNSNQKVIASLGCLNQTGRELIARGFKEIKILEGGLRMWPYTLSIE